MAVTAAHTYTRTTAAVAATPPSMQPCALQTTTDDDDDDGAAMAKQKTLPMAPRAERLKLLTTTSALPTQGDHAYPKHNGSSTPTRQQPDSGDIDETSITIFTVLVNPHGFPHPHPRPVGTPPISRYVWRSLLSDCTLIPSLKDIDKAKSLMLLDDWMAWMYWENWKIFASQFPDRFQNARGQHCFQILDFLPDVLPGNPHITLGLVPIPVPAETTSMGAGSTSFSRLLVMASSHLVTIARGHPITIVVTPLPPHHHCHRAPRVIFRSWQNKQAIASLPRELHFVDGNSNLAWPWGSALMPAVVPATSLLRSC
ncbi:hypothetical protein EDB89DRAFT_1904782 [Lactarius sanguifluus]|nr:hypothetical protein EDB89DRAFT_1904782 [Lactarius sanguifluus]